MAVGQNQWCHFGVGAPPILVNFSGDWDVHWGYGLLTHGQIPVRLPLDVSSWFSPFEPEILFSRCKVKPAMPAFKSCGIAMDDRMIVCAI